MGVAPFNKKALRSSWMFPRISESFVSTPETSFPKIIIWIQKRVSKAFIERRWRWISFKVCRRPLRRAIVVNIYVVSLWFCIICPTGDTRGGCLSIRHDDDHDEEETNRSDDARSSRRPEILFSYTDRVREVGAQDFTNILLNFLDTAKSLRERLVQATRVPKRKRCSVPPATGSSDQCRKRKALPLSSSASQSKQISFSG